MLLYSVDVAEVAQPNLTVVLSCQKSLQNPGGEAKKQTLRNYDITRLLVKLYSIDVFMNDQHTY